MALRGFYIVFTLFLYALAGGSARAADDAALFVPTSGWLVGPASVVPAADGASMPCVMAAQYDNGFTFRFSGGGERIMATAIDFHQSAFTPGQTYTMTLSVSPSFTQSLKGMAYNDAILLVNTQSVADLYKTLRQGEVMRIGIGGKEMDFMLAGAADGLARLESCYNPQEANNVTSRTTQQQDPPQQVTGMKTSPSYRPEQPQEPEEESQAQEPMPGNALPDDKTARFSLDNILKAAAKQVSGVEPAAGGAAFAAKQQDAAFTSSGEPQGEASAEGIWQVAEGASLRDSLENWSRAAGGRLVWAAADDFPVKESLSLSGRYQDAVASLLGQYSDEKQRPVGKMYKDPADNRPVLLVEAEGG